MNHRISWLPSFLQPWPLLLITKCSRIITARINPWILVMTWISLLYLLLLYFLKQIVHNNRIVLCLSIKYVINMNNWSKKSSSSPKNYLNFKKLNSSNHTHRVLSLLIPLLYQVAVRNRSMLFIHLWTHSFYRSSAMSEYTNTLHQQSWFSRHLISLYGACHTCFSHEAFLSSFKFYKTSLV